MAAAQDAAVALGQATKLIRQALTLSAEVLNPAGKKLGNACNAAITATKAAWDIASKAK